MKNIAKTIDVVNTLCVTLQANPVGARLLIALLVLGLTGFALYVVTQCLRS